MILRDTNLLDFDAKSKWSSATSPVADCAIN